MQTILFIKLTETIKYWNNINVKQKQYRRIPRLQVILHRISSMRGKIDSHPKNPIKRTWRVENVKLANFGEWRNISHWHADGLTQTTFEQLARTFVSPRRNNFNNSERCFRPLSNHTAVTISQWRIWRRPTRDSPIQRSPQRFQWIVAKGQPKSSMPIITRRLSSMPFWHE